MTTAEILDIGDCQAVKLPVEFHIDGEVVSIRREGTALILEPVASSESSQSVWPDNFFDQIHIEDPKFVRPDQGQLPPAPTFSWLRRLIVRYLLDTNTCIAVMRNEPVVVANIAATAPLDCAVSTVSAYELFTGVAKCSNPPREGAKVTKFLQTVAKLAFGMTAAKKAGEIRAQLEATGTIIGPYDLLLAGHAFSLSLTLVTANTREFGRVAGLALADWTK